jgi:hypothetical protein
MPPSSRAWRVAPIVAIVTLFAGYAAIARFGLEAYPMSGDEYSYLFQAEVFAKGRLSVPAPPHAELFDLDHVVLDEVARSKYPPGWPALLSLGCRAGAPWLVNPVLGALTLSLLHALLRRLRTERIALATVVVVGASPFFALNAASYHSHTTTLLMLTACAYGVLRGGASRLAWTALGGLALGYALLTRPFEAALFAVGMVVLWRTPKVIAACAAGAALVAAAMLPYQAAQFGSPFRTGYAAYEPHQLELYGRGNTIALSPSYAVSLKAWWDHLEWFVDLPAWLAPGLLALAILGAVVPPKLPAREETLLRRVLLAFPATSALGIVFRGLGYGDGYGPRYLLDQLLPIAFFFSAGCARLAVWWTLVAKVGSASLRRVPAILLAGVVGVALLRTATLTERSREEIDRRQALPRAVAAAGLHDAVVIVEARFPARFTRNGAAFDGDVVYVTAGGHPSWEVASFFPERSTFVAVERGPAAWSITPVMPR